MQRAAPTQLASRTARGCTSHHVPSGRVLDRCSFGRQAPNAVAMAVAEAPIVRGMPSPGTTCASSRCNPAKSIQKEAFITFLRTASATSCPHP